MPGRRPTLRSIRRHTRSESSIDSLPSATLGGWSYLVLLTYTITGVGTKLTAEFRRRCFISCFGQLTILMGQQKDRIPLNAKSPFLFMNEGPRCRLR